MNMNMLDKILYVVGKSDMPQYLLQSLPLSTLNLAWGTEDVIATIRHMRKRNRRSCDTESHVRRSHGIQVVCTVDVPDSRDKLGQ